jgi:DNA (cytosine-5)-methyltransferase 1
MTTKGAYYNEIDEYAAEWLENLIAAGHIADGVVDKRSIKEVMPEDLKGFNQCHFFAGIGVWSHSLRLAGVGDDQHVWTGSCPCQPFSSAGAGKGFEDERHLWPEFFRLIDACEPQRIMGEQVASNDGLAWLDLVFADLENSHYAVRATDTCAAGFGAPHVRQRLYWVADSTSSGLERHRGSFQGYDSEGRKIQNGHNREVRVCVGLADTDSNGCEQGFWNNSPARHRNTFAAESLDGGLANTESRGDLRQREGGLFSERVRSSQDGGWADRERPRPTNGFWEDADWLFCRDGKWRPVRPKTFPLVNGATSRMGRLRAYGNAINAHQARGFIESVMLSTDVEPRTVLSDYADIADLL